MISEKLKPCPFCGGKAVCVHVKKEDAMRRHPEKEGVLESYPDAWYVVGCETEDCILHLDPEKHFMRLGFRTSAEDVLIKRWNRRAWESTVIQNGNNNHCIHNVGTLNIG